MALSWNEIKDRALAFSKEWAEETREQAEAKSFWDNFFHIFGITRRRIASFEQPIKKLNQQYGFIDLFWKGQLLVEHKSKGKNLDKAYSQALDYFNGLKERELPKYVLVSDFARIRLYDLDEGTDYEFALEELHQHIHLFGFIAGYQKRVFKEADPVNIQAAELLGKLHDWLEESGYIGHLLEVFLVRILFCLFADDTGIFEQGSFKEFIEVKTAEDGSDLGALLVSFFQVLNTPKATRLKNLDESLNRFPYINGKLFEEPLLIPSFNAQMREMLLECSALDWGKISPAIFGSMFQSVMKPEERRNLGAHYTSEKNIMKLIKPLFLDELQADFEKAKENRNRLKAFHKKLANLKFLDPACGCGNFLIISYRELRLLEIEILRELDKNGQQVLDISSVVQVEVDQFYGIEYDEWPARISEVAMWLMDHQMNLRVSEEFGQYFARLPLKKSANIVNGNALQIDWKKIVPKTQLNYILGNPPFYGKQLQTKEQKQDIDMISKGIKGAGVLDYVTCWYLKASQYIQKTRIKAAFVSTNSISQGEQVGILWNKLFSQSIKIHFAHRTFKWSNEAKGNAQVYVIIIGFANFEAKQKRLFEYQDIKGEAHEKSVKNINPYLVEGLDLIILKRRKPICDVPKISFGSMPNDGGNLLLTSEEKENLIKIEPEAEKFIRPLISAKEFLNHKKRWCLWLKSSLPQELRKLKEVKKRVEATKTHRINSNRETTRKLADFPSLFGEDRQPSSKFISFPLTTSETRFYIPLAFFDKENIVNNTCSVIPNATKYHFGVLHSKMHIAWTKYVCGRLEGRIRYSNEIVYNNFPWPKNPTKKNQNKVETAVQKVLDVRTEFPDSSLADLYDPLTMPPKLIKAHQALDKVVDLCYRPQVFANEMVRIEYLFYLYNQYVKTAD
ncbi:MAG: class I SAM-dependent DNA methyltransferase [Thiomargarita sp.]|nr:class I SAM-dependent DNA methyltransferase [Thiomargarita sp.]